MPSIIKAIIVKKSNAVKTELNNKQRMSVSDFSGLFHQLYDGIRMSEREQNLLAELYQGGDCTEVIPYLLLNGILLNHPVSRLFMQILDQKETNFL